MAAFELVSKVNIKPMDDRSMVDIRSVTLPPPSDKSELDFDPREHRDPIQPISPWMAYFNLLRSLFGAGLLGMPLAVSQAGMLLGPLIVTFTGLLVTHMNMTLLQVLNEVARRLHIPYISYRYGFRIALLHGPEMFHCIGKCGPSLIACFMLMSQLGICIVFITFTSDSLRDIMDWPTSKKAILALFLPYLLLELTMKSLKIVSYASILGNILNITGLIMVFMQVFKDPHGEREEMVLAVDHYMPMLYCFGMCLFNMCSIGVILSLDKALVNPKIMTDWCGVLTVSFGVISIVSVIFGTLGYWAFGAMDENILRSLPFDETVSFVTVGLYMVAVALAFPIQCYPAIQIVLDVIKNARNDPPKKKCLKATEWVLRPLFVLTAFVLSYSVPFQAPFVAFVGNLCTTSLCLIFPAMMDISIHHPDNYGKWCFRLIKNIIIIVIGMTSLLFGVVFCIYLLYVRIMSTYSPHDKT